MELLPIDTSVFALLEDAAEQAYKEREKDDVLGPDEEDEEDIEYEYQELDDEADSDITQNEINVTVENTYDNDDEASEYSNADIDTDDLEEGIEALNKATNKNQELLESIDSTLEEQLSAEEKERRKNAISVEHNSPFSSLIAAGDVGTQDSNSGGGLLGALGDLAGFGGGGKDKDSPKKPNTKTPKTKVGKWWSNIPDKRGKALGALIAGGLSYLAIDSVMSKTSDESTAAAGSMIGDKDDLLGVDNASEHKPIYTENSTNQTTDTTLLTQKQNTEERESETVDKSATSQSNITSFASSHVEPIHNPETNSMPIAAATGMFSVAGLGMLALTKMFNSAPTEVLSTSVPVDTVLDTASDSIAKPKPKVDLLNKVPTESVKSGSKKIPIIGPLISAALLGSDIIDQRNQEYATDRDKNKDTAGVVGKWGAETAGAIAGAQGGAIAGAAIGSLVPLVGTVVGGVVGSIVGGIGGYFAVESSGLSEVMGEAASNVYDVVADSAASVGSMYDNVSNFFTSEKESNEEITEIQKDTFKDLKEDIEDKTSPLSPSMFSNIFNGGGIFGSSPKVASTTNAYTTNTTPTKVATNTSSYKVQSENNIVIPTPEAQKEQEVLTASIVGDVVNNVYNQNQTAKPKNGGGLVQKKPSSISKPESSSYAAQKPGLSNTPVYIDDATLGLINVGFV